MPPTDVVQMPGEGGQQAIRTEEHVSPGVQSLLEEFSSWVATLPKHAGEADVAHNAQLIVSDSYLSFNAKSGFNTADGLRAGVGTYMASPSFGVMSGRQEPRPRTRMAGLAKQEPAQLVIVPEVLSYFGATLAETSGDTARNWRRLSGRLGGAYRGYGPDALEYTLPVYAATNRTTVEFEECAYSICVNLWSALIVESLGGTRAQRPNGAGVMSDCWENFNAVTVNRPEIASADLVCAGYTAAGAGAAFAPLAQAIPGAPPGTGDEAAVLLYLLGGRAAPGGWGGVNPLPPGPVNPDAMPVVADRNLVLSNDDLSLLLAILGSSRPLCGWPNLAANNPGTHMPEATRRELRRWRHVVLTGRCVGAAVPAQDHQPTAGEIYRLMVHLSQLWNDEATWVRAMCRAAGDVVNFAVQPSAGGAGMGGVSPSRGVAPLDWVVGEAVGPFGYHKISPQLEIDTFAYLFANIHVSVKSMLPDILNTLTSVPSNQFVSWVAKTARRTATTAQLVLRANVATGDEGAATGSFGRVRQQMLEPLARGSNTPSGKYLGEYSGLRTSLVVELITKILDKSGAGKVAMYFGMSDLWDVASQAAGRRYLDLFQVDAPFYFITESCFSGVNSESFTLLQDGKLVRYSEVLAATEMVQFRQNVAARMGTTLDLEPSPNVKLAAAIREGRDTRLQKMVKGIGAVAWGAMVVANTPAAARLLTFERRERALYEAIGGNPVGNVTMSFDGGFARTTSLPVFHQQAAVSTELYLNRATPAYGNIVNTSAYLRGNVAEVGQPLQFVADSAMIRYPAAGIEAKLLDDVLSF